MSALLHGVSRIPPTVDCDPQASSSLQYTRSPVRPSAHPLAPAAMSPLPQEGSEEYLVHFCALFRQPARPPPRGKGLRASLGALMPRGFNPLASATAVSRLFDHHEVARRVLITGMEGAGKSTLLARALGQDEAERDGQLSYHAPVVGMPLCEVRFGPLLPRSPARMGPFGNEPPREQHCFWEYDLGGARKRRWAERALIADNDAVIWVLDAASYWDRACEIKYEIKKMLIEPDLGGGQFAPIEQPHDRPFLLLVNKHQRKTRVSISC